MADQKFEPSAEFKENAWIKSYDQYKEMYDRSIKDPDGFWAEIADQFTWFKKWDKVVDYNYDRREGKVFIEWFIATGYEHDAKPELEVYLPGDRESEDYRCQYWTPVVKKQ